MKSILICTILIGLSLLCGCIASLHPVYTQEDLVFDQALVGTWKDNNGQESWTFSKEGEKEYHLVYTDSEDKKGFFEARLFKIGQHRFIDFYPLELDQEPNNFYMFHLFPVHTFFHVQQIEPNLQMRPPDPEWFKKYAREHTDVPAFEIADDRAVLTDEPKAIQKFFAAHLETAAAYGDFSDLKKVEEEK
jgi:hypothetical protein